MEKYIVPAVILGIALLIRCAAAPYNRRRDRMAEYAGVYFAHRGLHNLEKGIPENSMTAFERARLAGYGIELDIRLTSDSQFAVMHDRNLMRACGIDRNVDELSMNELKKLTLFGTRETVPRFYDVLKRVAGRVPLLIEVKCEHGMDFREIVKELAFYLDTYEGKVLVQSFHPGILMMLAKERPQYLRGQLSERFSGMPVWMKVFSSFLFNFLAKPDFISYRIEDSGFPGFVLQRWVFKAFAAGWTLKSPATEEEQKGNFDFYIFEGFLPEKHNEAAPGKVRNMDKYVRKHIIVSGDVQGVGFRYHASYAAQRCGVTGWVRNLYDGRVELEVQGTEEQIGLMFRSVEAQRFVEITDREIENIPTEPHEYEFKVRY